MIKLIRSDCLKRMKEMKSNSIDALLTDPPAGISFMGKNWDNNKGGRDAWIDWLTEIMVEVHRILKPGAHGLVWAIPRTSHWTTTALENVGFEIRDVIIHLFGSGFPKSHDISKAIDKAYGAEREVVGVNPSSRPNSKVKGGRGFDASLGHESAGFQLVTAPATNEAKKWNGFGTALKPSAEMWLLIRKPISEKTIAANVLKWGVGGINIDGCRISSGKTLNLHGHYENDGFKTSNQGRWPANTVLSGDVPEMLDKQSGETGGASRFFYCAKPSKKERGEKNIHPTVKPIKLMQYFSKLITPENGIVIDPFMGSGTTGIAAIKEGFSFIGIEKEKEYFLIAKERIRGNRAKEKQGKKFFN